jgi:excisionase family DNA binding protein
MLSEQLKTKNPNELYGDAEAAPYLGVSKGTLGVWRCTNRYHIPYIKVGRLVKYRKSDLDAFLAARTVGGEA